MKRLPTEQYEALALFKAEHGRTWKQALRDLWMSSGADAGKADAGTLRQIRNEFGNEAFKLFDKKAVEPTTTEVIEQSKALNYATDKALLASVRKFTKGRVTVRKADGEYRLRLDGDQKSDYFTSDREDAYNSAIAMLEHVVGELCSSDPVSDDPDQTPMVDRTGGVYDQHSPRWQVIFHTADGRDYCRETQLAHTAEDEAACIKVGMTHAEVIAWAIKQCIGPVASFTLESW